MLFYTKLIIKMLAYGVFLYDNQLVSLRQKGLSSTRNGCFLYDIPSESLQGFTRREKERCLYFYECNLFSVFNSANRKVLNRTAI